MDDYCWSVRYFWFYFEQILLILTFAEKLDDTVQHVWVRFEGVVFIYFVNINFSYVYSYGVYQGECPL